MKYETKSVRKGIWGWGMNRLSVIVVLSPQATVDDHLARVRREISGKKMKLVVFNFGKFWIIQEKLMGPLLMMRTKQGDYECSLLHEWWVTNECEIAGQRELIQLQKSLSLNYQQNAQNVFAKMPEPLSFWAKELLRYEGGINGCEPEDYGLEWVELQLNLVLAVQVVKEGYCGAGLRRWDWNGFVFGLIESWVLQIAGKATRHGETDAITEEIRWFLTEAWDNNLGADVAVEVKWRSWVAASMDSVVAVEVCSQVHADTDGEEGYELSFEPELWLKWSAVLPYFCAAPGNGSMAMFGTCLALARR